MAVGDLKDPAGSYNFLVEIDGITRAAFRECTGLESTVETVEYREGGGNLTTRKLPGRTSFGNITLRWGITDDRELYDWHREVVDGATERRNGSIVLLNRRGEEIRRWNFERAWPPRYQGPEFNAEGNEIAIETLELAHEGLALA